MCLPNMTVVKYQPSWFNTFPKSFVPRTYEQRIMFEFYLKIYIYILYIYEQKRKHLDKNTFYMTLTKVTYLEVKLNLRVALK